MSEHPRIAFVSTAGLRLAFGKTETPVDSAFIRKILERRESDRERDSWREDSVSWNTGTSPYAEMGLLAKHADSESPVRFRSVATGSDGLLYYAVELDTIGALLEFDLNDDHERRIMHGPDARFGSIDVHPDDDRVVLSKQQDAGVSHIGVLDPRGGGVRLVTEGDVMDDHPCWVGNDTIVYHSAGIGRNQQGMFIGYGPSAIHSLDIENGRFETLAEDPQFDYLCPRMSEDGALYCIRRPYEFLGRVDPLKLIGDVLLFPIRAVRVVVHIFDFLSQIFVRKPILTARSQRPGSLDQRRVLLLGKAIDAERELKRRNNPHYDIVPKDWSLVRISDGTEEVIEHHVVAFDLDGSGGVVWTNGSRVVHTPGSGPTTELARSKLIERVAVLS